MERLTQKTITVSRSHTYTCYTHQADIEGQPTVLLIHGWPDSAEIWSGFITDHLLPNGYGAVALDGLGYGGTSKPLDEKEYDFRAMSADVVEILDTEKLATVACLAHDWGVGLASRLYNFHPDRLSALILAAVPYFPPMSSLFDLDALIQHQLQHQHQTQTPDNGKPSFITSEYFRFFTADDAPQILLAHLESLWTVLHGYPQTWLDLWSVRDAMRDFLLADKRQPVMPYAATDEARKQKFFHRMRRDGFDAPLRWYRALTFGFQDEANAAAAAPENAMVVKCPMLFVCGGEDVGSREEDFDDQVKAGLILDATKVVVDNVGHWSMLAQPEEFGSKIVDWLREKY
ncbi:hypothetical protein LTR46_000038 [Exophiala xenobiotica]|nr:hypothetical protein LTR46_000038 [Exophiala xenobiotica]